MRDGDERARDARDEGGERKTTKLKKSEEGEKREQKDNVAAKSQVVDEKEKFITDREDESKLEIPAFLRRQAN